MTCFQGGEDLLNWAVRVPCLSLHESITQTAYAYFAIKHLSPSKYINMEPSFTYETFPSLMIFDYYVSNQFQFQIIKCVSLEKNKYIQDKKNCINGLYVSTSCLKV